MHEMTSSKNYREELALQSVRIFNLAIHWPFAYISTFKIGFRGVGLSEPGFPVPLAT